MDVFFPEPGVLKVSAFYVLTKLQGCYIKGPVVMFLKSYRYIFEFLMNERFYLFVCVIM